MLATVEKRIRTILHFHSKLKANPIDKLHSIIPEDFGGLRLDQALARLFPDYSRSKLQSWIRNERVSVNGTRLRPKDRIQGGELVVVDTEPEIVLSCEAEAIPLSIIHEDSSLIVINKPVGLVVHPAVGNPNGTLQNALLHHFPDLATLPRAGIIHRIDKDTSGLLVVARSLTAHKKLVSQLQSRTMGREYLALAYGKMTAGGKVDAAIGRHPRDRRRNTVSQTGKPAITYYRIHERFSFHTLLRVRLDTGRTHQIRVHMAHIRYPLVGDPVYGGRLRIPPACPEPLIAALQSFRRQALHADRLAVIHPETEKQCRWEIPVPEDFEKLLQTLREAEPVLAQSKH